MLLVSCFLLAATLLFCVFGFTCHWVLGIWVPWEPDGELGQAVFLVLYFIAVLKGLLLVH